MTKNCRASPIMTKLINKMIPETLQEAIEVLFYRSKKNPKEIRKFVTECGRHLDSSTMSRFLNENAVRGPDIVLIKMIEDFCQEYPVTDFLLPRKREMATCAA